MSALWTREEALAATGGRAQGSDWQAAGVSIDTRTLQPGDLFVALTAARDGHDFVADALAKGASAALVSRLPAGVGEDATTSTRRLRKVTAAMRTSSSAWPPWW